MLLTEHQENLITEAVNALAQIDAIIDNEDINIPEVNDRLLESMSRYASLVESVESFGMDAMEVLNERLGG